MMRLLVPILGALLVACATSSRTTETTTTTAASATASASIEGVYDYIANLPGQQVRGKKRHHPGGQRQHFPNQSPYYAQ